MGVVWIRNHWPQRSGTFSSITKNRQQRHWKILVDSKNDDQNTIAAKGLQLGIFPSLYQSHPNNLYTFAESLKITQQSDSWKHWEAVAEYSDQILTQSEQDEESLPPLSRPAKITWTSAQYERAIIFDAEGNAINNSAGIAYAAQVVDDARWVVHFEKNLPYAPTWILTYNNVVNSGPFSVGGLTIPTGLAKLQGLGVSEVKTEQDQVFVTVSGDLHFRQEGWALELLDEGFEEIDGTSTKPILDNLDKPVRTAHPLNGSGAKLANPSTATAHTRSFTVYFSRDLSILPLS